MRRYPGITTTSEETAIWVFTRRGGYIYLFAYMQCHSVGLNPNLQTYRSNSYTIATMTVTHSKTILVTGASGFLATHIVKAFLQQGYYVRGTVRSDQAAANVRKGFSQYSDRLSFAIVEDISQPGAFNEAVEGVDGVRLCIHAV